MTPTITFNYTHFKPINLIYFYSPPNRIPSVELISDIRIDYKPLEKLLLNQKWQEADRETAAIILRILNRETEGWLGLGDIEKVPCRDLLTIDQLWVKYSNGRFGFSIQKQIWEKVGGNLEANNKTWEIFGKRVGWHVKFLVCSDRRIKYLVKSK